MFDFRGDNAFGGFDEGRQRLFDRIRQKKLPPIGETPPIGQTPPIIGDGPPPTDDVRHMRPSIMPGNHTAQAMPWKQQLGGVLGSLGSMGGGEEEESYLEPMQMQPQQGQVFAPQQASWMMPPRKPFRRF